MLNYLIAARTSLPFTHSHVVASFSNRSTNLKRMKNIHTLPDWGSLLHTAYNIQQ